MSSLWYLTQEFALNCLVYIYYGHFYFLYKIILNISIFIIYCPVEIDIRMWSEASVMIGLLIFACECVCLMINTVKAMCISCCVYQLLLLCTPTSTNIFILFYANYVAWKAYIYKGKELRNINFVLIQFVSFLFMFNLLTLLTVHLPNIFLYCDSPKLL